MILIIDNYDSFVFNLARYGEEMGQDCLVLRPSELSLEKVRSLSPTHIIISPGPCSPAEAPFSCDVIRHFGPEIPILGVCLGHQCIGYVFGGDITRAPKPMHGKTSPIFHNQEGLFRGLPSPYEVTRYHSLVIAPETCPSVLRVTAKTEEGVIMAVEHEDFPIYGVQFHPEAHMTSFGYELLQNFFDIRKMEERKTSLFQQN
jgi:anthranilate synthase/aminodeoxychorismate synthase-like glutamine amidotransferase